MELQKPTILIQVQVLYFYLSINEISDEFNFGAFKIAFVLSSFSPRLVIMFLIDLIMLDLIIDWRSLHLRPDSDF